MHVLCSVFTFDARISAIFVLMLASSPFSRRNNGSCACAYACVASEFQALNDLLLFFLMFTAARNVRPNNQDQYKILPWLDDDVFSIFYSIVSYAWFAL